MTIATESAPSAHLPESRPDIHDLVLAELAQVVIAAGEREFRARQVMGWLYGRNLESFEGMSDVPAALRECLGRRFALGPPPQALVSRSGDGTRKILLKLGDGEEIESVIIPSDGRVTLCMSSQVGCAMGCEFCATARMGLHRNLGVGEMLSQIFVARGELRELEEFTNYVFMGMGEPLANYPRLLKVLTIMTSDWGMGISPRRITVSTVGLVPMMEQLLADIPVNLAVSIHAADDQLRDRLVPINRHYPLEELVEACKRLPLRRRRRVTFEYVMLEGVNDLSVQAQRLAKLLAPIRAKVNLIFFNPYPGAPFRSSSRAAAERFQATLRRGNLTATVRESRGADIAAACGQLYVDRHVGR
ncbi:MAG: 23S rRNA (adenine(2503)-C(2))-methyltransferase RlmN [Candidatus Binataceae bacterium]